MSRRRRLTIGQLLGLLPGLLACTLAFSADAAHFESCPHPYQLDSCYPLFEAKIESELPASETEVDNAPELHAQLEEGQRCAADDCWTELRSR
jgi:hypothetical protein